MKKESDREEARRKEENERPDDCGSGIFFAQAFLCTSAVMPKRYSVSRFFMLICSVTSR